MIKIENVDITGWSAAIRGMRNPLNSWKKSDTDPNFCDLHKYGVSPTIGEYDLKLMKNLANAGPDHGKFLRMIVVTLDITAPLYWWKEFDTYKVGTVANSCSTMHKIHDKPFDLDDFSHEHLRAMPIQLMKNLVSMLNLYRTKFLDTGDKIFWWQLIQLLPSSYNQRRTVQLNYAVLRAMYHARRNHKLDEWRDFCRWIETLPASELITDG